MNRRINFFTLFLFSFISLIVSALFFTSDTYANAGGCRQIDTIYASRKEYTCDNPNSPYAKCDAYSNTYGYGDPGEGVGVCYQNPNLNACGNNDTCGYYEKSDAKCSIVNANLDVYPPGYY